MTAQSGEAATRRGVARALLARWLREPLLHFLVFGSLLFAATGAWQARHDPQRIVVDRGTVERIAQAYATQFGAPPSAGVLRTLVDGFIEDEALYREGVRLGLDKDDEVVRRRVVHKMRFLTEDMLAPPEPSARALREYYDRSPSRYRQPALLSFTHVYFAGSQAPVRAAKVLESLPDDQRRASERGDPFSDLYEYVSLDRVSLERLFGRTPIVKALSVAAVEHWEGPFGSAYGWHLIRVSSRTHEGRYPFEEVRDRVRDDWLAAFRARQNDAALAKLKRRYRVTDSSPEMQ